MNKIRSALAPMVLAIGLAAAGQVEAQPPPLPYTLQVDPGIPSTTTRQAQDEVIELMNQHLGLWLAPDPGSYPYERLLTDDAVFEYPQSDDPAVRRVEGRAAVVSAIRNLPREAVDWRFSDVKLIETPHPDIFFIAYRAKAYVPATRRTYDQLFVARVTVREGKIANYFEMWDQKAKAVAFGISMPRKPS
jgi:hypothetical protein